MNLLQNLIHESLVATGHVECAAIIRRKDSSIRATSVGYVPSPEQIEAIIAAFKNPPQAREHGIYFNGASYSCIRADKNSIYAKKLTQNFGYSFDGVRATVNKHQVFKEMILLPYCVPALKFTDAVISHGYYITCDDMNKDYIALETRKITAQE